ncbi:hypothetical protein [Glycomyces paridis]|uniref:Uncharacterized protein n=1 Tax=Glycomyces paridis TaxID=2126555 RepID=A0A4S8P8S2_9ACTN|nr:hypothetical protein [Glycomyces paridis]THV25995.1 hypothetical protein E9998_19875 [Glycomyces paridis]
MTWPPREQGACEPGCTCTDTPAPSAPVYPNEPLRECGVTGCIHCDIVYPVPGGGDRLPTRKATT